MTTTGAEATEHDDGGFTLDTARRALRDARRDAAATRIRVQQVEGRLASSMLPEELQVEVDAIRQVGREANRPLLIENIANRFRLPDELADVLRGDTREELTEHARVLAKFA